MLVLVVKGFDLVMGLAQHTPQYRRASQGGGSMRVEAFVQCASGLVVLTRWEVET